MKNLSTITILTLYTTVSLAAPIPDATDAVELDSRQLGMIFRGVGKMLSGAAKVLKNLPEKAGKKMAKNQGNQGPDDVLTSKQLEQTTNRWSKFLGKEQDPKCVNHWTNNFAEYGGWGGNIMCDKNPAPLFGHKGGFFPSPAQSGMAPPRQKIDDLKAKAKTKAAPPPPPPPPKAKYVKKLKAKSASKSNGKPAPQPKAKSAPPKAKNVLKAKAKSAPPPRVKNAAKAKGRSAPKSKGKIAPKSKGKGGKKKRELLGDSLFGRVFMPVYLDLLQRVLVSDINLDERDFLTDYALHAIV